ncbi:MAG: hypothetical protein M1118_10065, partial [Chloroflexi bacterium]|nr:hypothetical protein [Chloroflexota bacterium]
LFATAWQREHGTLPETTPIRPLLGPEGLAPAVHGEISATALSAAAAVLNREVSQLQRIPAAARVGEQVLGPGALLRGLAQVVAGEKDQVVIDAGDELPALAQRADFAGLHFQNTWSIFPPEFEAPQLLQTARLQTWSARPAG